MMKKQLLILLLALPAGSLWAQKQKLPQTQPATDTSTFLEGGQLQETVVTGVAAPVKIQNALSQYRVITKDAMKAQGAATVADALSTQLNINLGNDAILGTNITMQGLGGDKVKVLIDGLPVNGRENGNIDLGQLSLQDVSRIEIVQGPMSVVYGSDALGGVINIITDKGSDKTKVSAGGLWESYGKYNADASADFHFNPHHNLQLGVGRNFSDAYGYADTAFPQRARTFKPKEQWLANLAYRFHPNEHFSATLASDFVHEIITARGSIIGYPYYATAVDEYYRTTRSNNRLQLEGKLGKGHWRLDNGYAFYRRVRESQIKDLVTLQEKADTSIGSQDTSRFDDITLRSNYASSIGKLRYDGGYDLLFQRARSGKFGDSVHAADDYALYGNAAMDFFKQKLTAQLGLRYAYNTAFSAPLIYSFNLLYHANERLQIRASAAKGFRAPSLKEQYLDFVDQNHNIIGNPNLKPEHGYNMQASATWSYGAQKPLHGALTATAYYNDVRNVISLANPDHDPASINRIYGNIARQRNAIGSLQAEGKWNSLYALVGASLTHVLAADSGYNAFNTLEATATLRYHYRPAKILLSVFYKYTGESRQLSAFADGTALYDVTLPAYSMMDASLSRRFWKGHIEVIAGLKNLFNVQQLSPTGTVSSVHSSGGGVLLPRRMFASLRLDW
ncbi:MAG: TonB-dependent receptor [Bacteroidetes bacterium]|nr:TonB-dependent receptor [Bacteroidota bacterium]